MITSFLYVYIYTYTYGCAYMCFHCILEYPRCRVGCGQSGYGLWYCWELRVLFGFCPKGFLTKCTLCFACVCVCTPFLHRAWCLVSFVQTTCGLAWTHAYHIQPGPARLGQGKHQRTLWSVPVHLGWKLLSSSCGYFMLSLLYVCTFEVVIYLYDAFQIIFTI